MVKRGRLPGRGGMTADTVLAQRAIMAIIALVTGKTIRRSALKGIVDMTPRAGCADMRASQFEKGEIVIKSRRLPGRGGMAGGTILAQRAIVAIITLMTGKTIRWSAFIDVIYMAACAGRTDMRASQLESREIVVESSRLPGGSGMADTAILTKLSVVVINVLVTGVTSGWSALKDIIYMATRTGCADMCTGQFEERDVVIKCGRLPGLAGMASSTVLAQRAVMAVIFLMAGKTIRRSTLEDIVDMTLFADHAEMLTDQFKGCQVVIKGRRFPGRGGMANTAVLAQRSIMLVILLVACKTIRRGAFKDIVDMAFFAQYCSVRAA